MEDRNLFHDFVSLPGWTVKTNGALFLHRSIYFWVSISVFHKRAHQENISPWLIGQIAGKTIADQCLWCEASRKHTALLFFSLIIPFLFGGLKEKCQLLRHFLCIYACLLIPINQTHIASTIFWPILPLLTVADQVI